MKAPPLSLKARALRYLSQREHSRLELTRKLGPYVQEGDDLEALLNVGQAKSAQVIQPVPQGQEAPTHVVQPEVLQP